MLKVKLHTIKTDDTKKFHTSSELSIVKDYLFWDRLTDHSPCHRTRNRNQIQQQEERESGCMPYIGIHSIRSHGVGNLIEKTSPV